MAEFILHAVFHVVRSARRNELPLLWALADCGEVRQLEPATLSPTTCPLSWWIKRRSSRCDYQAPAILDRKGRHKACEARAHAQVQQDSGHSRLTLAAAAHALARNPGDI